MALGTPVAAAVAYSALNGTSVTPAYPTGILTTDVVLLLVGQKPSTANGGTVTTPGGWTLREEILAQGGYGTTLGAGTGNTNLRIYSWDSPVAGQTGTLSVTLGTNNVSWSFMIRIPKGAGAAQFGSADGSRATAPTAGTPFTVTLTNGASATNFQSGDLAIWAMCIPDPVTTPSQFSAHSASATGATFATAVEFNEPDSTTGNDIAGFSAYASVSSGSSTAAPSITVTASGTVTNVRGPVAMVRIREAAVTHATTGTLTGQLGSVSGAAQRNVSHATSGVLAGQTATITGDADREAAVIPHTTDGALVGPGATITGAATRFRAHATSGALPGQTATITGDADHEELIIPHVTSGAIVGPGSTLDGSAFVSHLHATAGALAGPGAELAGDADLEPYVPQTHDTDGALEGAGAVVAGEASITGNQPVLPAGGGGSGPWSKKELRKRDSKLEQERQERQSLRQLVAQAIEPVKAAAPETVQVVTSAKAGVALLPSSGPEVALPALPQFDAAAVAREVQRALQEAGIAVQRVRQAQARQRAALLLEAARRENERRLRKRRRDEEILLLM